MSLISLPEIQMTQSSAYKRFCTFLDLHEGISQIIKLNNIGLKILPWGRPFSENKISEFSFPIFT